MEVQMNGGCRHAASPGITSTARVDAVHDDSHLAPLRRLSEVERTADPHSSLARIVSWVREFLVLPHPDLGRNGSVCPFVLQSIAMDTIWLAEVTDAAPEFDDVSAAITRYREQFLSMEPRSGSEAMQKAFLIVFPTLGADDMEDAGLVDKVQQALKRSFVDRGLMLGEFHSRNESPGLRNPSFRPLRSPVPMLAIRHMVESDLPFLARADYGAAERSSFLRSYLSRVGRKLTPTNFEQALDLLIRAEIGVWVANAKAAGIIDAAATTADTAVVGPSVRTLRRLAPTSLDISR